MTTSLISKSKAAARRAGGFTIIECLIYGMVLVLLLGVAYAAFYRCVENSYALRRSTDDLGDALRAGERWRAEIRTATNGIRIAPTAEGDVLQFESNNGLVAYRFASNAVQRQTAHGRWTTVLASVQASSMSEETRAGVTVWRWELELKPRTKQPVSMKPLLTFLAVPARSSQP